MEFIRVVTDYAFMRNALFAAVLTGVVCGLIGTYIVIRRRVFLSGGITHASFGGIGIAYWLGANPIWGAFLFAVIAALSIEFADRHAKIRQDSAIGMVWSFGMAVGVIFIYLTPGYAPNLMSFLFGNILIVSNADIWALTALVSLMLLLSPFFYRQAVYAAFDEDFARSRGVNVSLYAYVMALLVAISIVLCIRSLGIVLLISLLTVPSVIINSLSNSFSKISLWAALLAIVANIVGLCFSYYLNIPAAAATIFLLAFTLLSIKLLPLRRLKNLNSQ